LSLRTKEEAHDYRYFPEADLVPLKIDPEWVERIRATLPELPAAKRERLKELGLSGYEAGVLTSSKAMADYFDRVMQNYADAKVVANWIMGDLSALLKANNRSFEDCPIKPYQLADMLKLIKKGDISGKIAKTVLEEIYTGGKDPAVIVKEKGLVQIRDQDALEKIIAEVLAQNPKSVADYQGGKEKAFGFLVGQVMKATQGKANPELVNKILKEKLQIAY
jgi:aspartyl-tRNA(Asn)/glutamyl-tRNA(Gln) amidotransferase subunit B